MDYKVNAKREQGKPGEILVLRVYGSKVNDVPGERKQTDEPQVMEPT
jgi:hypothetical protein